MLREAKLDKSIILGRPTKNLMSVFSKTVNQHGWLSPNHGLIMGNNFNNDGIIASEQRILQFLFSIGCLSADDLGTCEASTTKWVLAKWL